MAKTPAVNTAPASEEPKVEGTAAEVMPDFSKWTDRQVSFAPYLKPEVGTSVYARVIAIDMRDPDFVRILLECLQPEVTCQRGPADEGNIVKVQKGKTFSMSAYHSMADELYFQVQSGISPPSYIEFLSKARTSNKRDVWQFRCRVSPEDDKKLNALYPKWIQERAQLMAQNPTPSTNVRAPLES